MSGAEYTDVSPAQTNMLSGKNASPKGSTLEHSQEFEQKSHLSSGIVQNEAAEICADVANHSVVGQLGLPSDDVTENSLSEFMESLPEDAIKKSDNDHLGSLPEDGTNHSSNEELGSTPEDATKNPCIEQLGSHPECETKDSCTVQLRSPLQNAAEQFETPHKDEIKDSKLSRCKDKKTSAKSSKKKYMLRSVVGTDRVLRSRSQEKPKAPEPSDNLVSVSASREKKRKKKKIVKKLVADEYSSIMRHLRYFLSRMSYEQSLIDAYSGEGWKGQSQEKIKPEKELQRASSEILRRKLKIRDLFQRLDSLCAEGKIPETAFDSDGEISSEDIFCAKCGSRDVSADNDIILCDGECDRGFHQLCVVPPLLKEDIPPDDEGWLCPGCDCKVDCIDLLNDSQGTDLSISDSWEKVFPEAAAASSGNMLDDNFGFPSDDSEDYEYDPEGPEVDGKAQGDESNSDESNSDESSSDESSSDDSDFTSESEDMEASPNDEQLPGLSSAPSNDGQLSGLPSEDSEDDDYDPDGSDLDAGVKQESSSSDFTSASEDFDAALDDNKCSDNEEGPTSSSMNYINSRKSKLSGKKKQSKNSELLSILESDSGIADSSPVSGKRLVERLDYKKLHDETYGNISSDSSDDEDFTDAVAPRKRKNNSKNEDVKETEHAPKRRNLQNLNSNGSPAKSLKNSSEPGSDGKRAAPSASKGLGEAIKQRLYTSFKENQYPDRATKENLAKELEITFRQVDKWFGNARWSHRHGSPSKKASAAKSAPNTDTTSTPRKLDLLDLEPQVKACNGVTIKESPKPSVALKECSEKKVPLEESSGKKLTPSNSKSRKKKVAIAETPKAVAESPKVAVEESSEKNVSSNSRKKKKKIEETPKAVAQSPKVAVEESSEKKVTSSNSRKKKKNSEETAKAEEKKITSSRSGKGKKLDLSIEKTPKAEEKKAAAEEESSGKKITNSTVRSGKRKKSEETPNASVAEESSRLSSGKRKKSEETPKASAVEKSSRSSSGKRKKSEEKPKASAAEKSSRSSSGKKKKSEETPKASAAEESSGKKSTPRKRKSEETPKMSLAEVKTRSGVETRSRKMV